MKRGIGVVPMIALLVLATLSGCGGPKGPEPVKIIVGQGTDPVILDPNDTDDRLRRRLPEGSDLGRQSGAGGKETATAYLRHVGPLYHGGAGFSPRGTSVPLPPSVLK